MKSTDVTISFAITVCNERDELKRLLDQLLDIAKPTDEIIIQIDETNSTLAVRDLIEDYQHKNSIIKSIYFPLNANFAAFKNNLKSHCTKKYVFQIDADEFLGVFLCEIHEIIASNPNMELFHLFRINTVSDMPPEYVLKMGWRVDYQNYYEGLPIVNWPDVQARLFKNLKRIKWSQKVHERISGHKTFCVISNGNAMDIEGNRRFSLIHQKTYKKQLVQNEFYDNIAKNNK